MTRELCMETGREGEVVGGGGEGDGGSGNSTILNCTASFPSNQHRFITYYLMT